MITNGAKVSGTLWVYAYEMMPPKFEEQLSAIRTMLAREHADAKGAARRWTGNLVCESVATHILVVTDSPDQDREVNRRIEAWLTEQETGFSLTAPMLIADDETPSPEADDGL
jgi:hypothetical protein